MGLNPSKVGVLYPWARCFISTHCCLMQLFIDFFDQNVMFYFTRIGNPVQIIKHVELSMFQPILKLSVTLNENLFTLKAVYW